MVHSHRCLNPSINDTLNIFDTGCCGAINTLRFGYLRKIIRIDHERFIGYKKMKIKNSSIHLFHRIKKHLTKIGENDERFSK